MIIAEIALILILSKVFSDLASRVKQPPVLGLLVLGLLLGPSGFHLIVPNEVMDVFSKIGVLVLLFMVGLETNIRPKEAKVASLIAAGGVVLPFGLGLLCGLIFGRSFAQSLILGTILTATSVSVSVMTLLDINKLKTPEGKAILTAAIIDDIIGILVVTLVIGFIDVGSNLGLTILKIVSFFIISYLAGFPCLWILNRVNLLRAREAVIAIAFGIMLLYAYMASSLGLAAITGAYLAGLVLRNTRHRRELLSGIDIIGHSIFISFFFVDIGLKTELSAIHGGYLFVVCLIVFAIVSKLGGVFAGSSLMHLKPKKGLRIGIGMIPRGEVALAIASLALSRGFILEGDFSSVVIMVIFLTFCSPALLKWSFRTEG